MRKLNALLEAVSRLSKSQCRNFPSGNTLPASDETCLALGIFSAERLCNHPIVISHLGRRLFATFGPTCLAWFYTQLRRWDVGDLSKWL